MLFKRKNPKIFCIGRNKTGTTSLSKAFVDLGFKLGDQVEAEWLFDDWVKRDFSKLKRYCQNAEVFQDSPFSLPYTFVYLDQIFPNSKFILTVRDSALQWYHSLVRFHAKLWANDGVRPTKDDLKRAFYLYEGFPYDAIKRQFGTPDDDLYCQSTLIKAYEDYNQSVVEYFKYKPDSFLHLNVGKPDSYWKFCAFLNKKPIYDEFPWEQKTEDLKV
ncbi:MAG: hypothetical protein A3E85_04375 [Gammaproteobacteria bacterium RIFCSPHIGHO2_12_FULL_45_12]|nr:MAG: hypothetical protein A3E85_04375 [Gammaproteobacteria bacterium RIFCSPHIGHO2_12_FULL_45_12]